MLEVEETQLSPESRRILVAVEKAIQKLGQPSGCEAGADLARAYAARVISRRPMLRNTPENEVARTFSKRHELVNETSTQKEIANFKKAAEKLLTATLALHAPARHALGLTDTLRARPGFALEEKVKELIEKSEHPAVPGLPKNAGLGRKKATSEAAFTRELAKTFHLWTGKKPTIIVSWADGIASGDFLDFVTEIFAIFQVKSKPLAQARAAIEAMKIINAEKPQ